MCCGHAQTLDLAPAALEMLARYRDLQRRHGWDWGEENLPDAFRWARFNLLGPVMERVGDSGDWGAAVRSVLGDGPVPSGIVVPRRRPGPHRSAAAAGLYAGGRRPDAARRGPAPDSRRRGRWRPVN